MVHNHHYLYLKLSFFAFHWIFLISLFLELRGISFFLFFILSFFLFERELFGTSKYLVDIMHSSFNKNEHWIINLKSFVNEARTWQIDEVKLYPPVSIDKAIGVLIDTSDNYIGEIKTDTKLKLSKLCVSKYYFHHEDRIRLLENADPFCISLIVMLSKSYLQH